jgi:nitrate/nitrite transport system substrate-binding protein
MWGAAQAAPSATRPRRGGRAALPSRQRGILLMTDTISSGRRMTVCACGEAHDPGIACEGLSDTGMRARVETAVLRAAFPNAVTRRSLLSTIGSATLLGALSQVFPIGTATDLFAQAGPLEKTKLAVGFIPITCATPIIMAHPLGFYTKQKLDVDVVKTAGWAVVRDKTLNKEYDVAHMLAPMPIAITLGLGSTAAPFTVPAIQNVNGQAICLAMKLKDQRDPKSWKGLRFAIPFDYSIHNYLLRYYLAENGIDPDQDVQLRVVPPPDMVANLRAGNIDGFLAPDNVVQRAVFDGIGFIHLISEEMWDGHPCCAFAARQEFVTEMPNTYAALNACLGRGVRLCVQAREQKADRRSDCAGQLSQCAGAGARPGAHRDICRRARRHQARPQPRHL